MRSEAQKILCEHFGPFGKLDFEYHKMGNIDSLDLFGVTELIIFAIYWKNQKRWKKVLDIGANLGLHSIIMSKLGWIVHAYEPDPEHFKRLLRNVSKLGVETHNVAVSTKAGTARFVRVLNNLTGNHLFGYKDSFGPREFITVSTVKCKPLFDWADFAKIDCEGNEADLLSTTTEQQMKHLDVIVEVRNGKNAKAIYDHFQSIHVPMYSQKNDWKRVRSLTEVPHVNREGSLFIGHKPPL